MFLPIFFYINLGVAPVYSDSHEYVLNQRLAVYNYLLHALQVLRVVDETTAKSKIFYAMYLLENKNLKSGFNVNVCSNKNVQFLLFKILSFSRRTVISIK